MEHTFNLRQISKKKKEKRKKGIFQKKKKKKLVPSVVAHAFNRSIREAEADRLMCSRPAWSTQ